MSFQSQKSSNIPSAPKRTAGTPVRSQSTTGRVTDDQSVTRSGLKVRSSVKAGKSWNPPNF